MPRDSIVKVIFCPDCKSDITGYFDTLLEETLCLLDSTDTESESDTDMDHIKENTIKGTKLRRTTTMKDITTPKASSQKQPEAGTGSTVKRSF